MVKPTTGLKAHFMSVATFAVLASKTVELPSSKETLKAVQSLALHHGNVELFLRCLRALRAMGELDSGDLPASLLPDVA